MGFCLFFDIQSDGNLGIAIKGDRLHRAHLHPGKPDIVPRLQPLDIIEDNMEADAFDKHLMLPADGEDSGYQDGKTEEDEDPDRHSFFYVDLAHVFMLPPSCFYIDLAHAGVMKL